MVKIQDYKCIKIISTQKTFNTEKCETFRKYKI